MLSAIWREAPLRLCFERSPRLAASAAPAAICCFFDLAGMTVLLATSPGMSRRDILTANVRGDVRFRRPTEADGRVLSRRHLDRRRAIPSPLRHALVEPALVKHGIGEPDAAAHDEHQENQQHDVGDPALSRGLHVFVAVRRFWLVHAGIVASKYTPRNSRDPAERDAKINPPSFPSPLSPVASA